MSSTTTQAKPKKIYHSNKHVLFFNFVQVGRLALITYGPDKGKICIIVDIIDIKRVLVDGPHELTGVRKQVIKTDYLRLMPHRVKGVRINMRKSGLKKILLADKTLEKFANAQISKNSKREKYKMDLLTSKDL